MGGKLEDVSAKCEEIGGGVNPVRRMGWSRTIRLREYNCVFRDARRDPPDAGTFAIAIDRFAAGALAEANNVMA